MKRRLSETPSIPSKRRPTQDFDDDLESAVQSVFGLPEILETICFYIFGSRRHDPLMPTYRITKVSLVSKAFKEAARNSVRRVTLCTLNSRDASEDTIRTALKTTPKATELHFICGKVCGVKIDDRCGAFIACNICFTNELVTSLKLAKMKRFCFFSIGSFSNLVSLHIKYSNYCGYHNFSKLQRLTKLKLEGVSMLCPVTLPFTLKKLSIYSSDSKHLSDVFVFNDLPNLEKLTVSSWLRDEGWEEEDIWENAPFSQSYFPKLKVLIVQGINIYTQPIISVTDVEEYAETKSENSTITSYRILLPGFGSVEDLASALEPKDISTKIPLDYDLKSVYRKDWYLREKSRPLIENLKNMLWLFQYFNIGWVKGAWREDCNFRLGRLRRLHDWMEKEKEFPVFNTCKEVGNELSKMFPKPSE